MLAHSSYDAGTFTVSGAGADIWGTADGFHDVYLPYFRDGQIVARVTHVQSTDPFAKAGVMLRGSYPIGAADADNVILDVRPTGDIEFMARPSSGAPTTFIAGASHDLPVWLKLARVGATVTGSISADGLDWTAVGTTTVPQFEAMDIGLAVTSHNTSALNTSTFDTVAVTGGVVLMLDISRRIG
jgi:hypothetical protein